jgi:hypothetical protein
MGQCSRGWRPDAEALTPAAAFAVGAGDPGLVLPGEP